MKVFAKPNNEYKNFKNWFIKNPDNCKKLLTAQNKQIKLIQAAWQSRVLYYRSEK